LAEERKSQVLDQLRLVHDAMAELAEFAEAGSANDVGEITESAERSVYLIVSLVPLRLEIDDYGLRGDLTPVVSVAIRALDAMENMRPSISDNVGLVNLGVSLRAMGFWLSAICGGWDVERPRAEELLRSALSWPSLYSPVESVLLNYLLPDSTFELRLSDRELRQTVARYLSLPVFTSDVETMFEQAHRSKDAGHYGGAATLFRAAGSHAPDRLNALLGEVISLLRAAVNEFHMRATSLAEVVEPLRLLRLALFDRHAVDLWRLSDMHRWKAVWDASGTVFAEQERSIELSSGDAVDDAALEVFFKRPHRPAIHEPRAEVDPESLVTDALARIYVLDEFQNGHDENGDPYSVMAMERSWAPSGWTKDWALLQLRDFLSGSSAGQDMERSLRDLDDGLRALYRRTDLGFELGAKELSLGRLDTELKGVYTSSREAALSELEQRLGPAWKRIEEPIRGQLVESETQFQLQGRSRLGSQNLIALGYASTLEAGSERISDQPSIHVSR
jgi:hypothetical protein